MARPPASEILRFGPYELDSAAGELRRGGLRVKLQPQPLKVLARLARDAGAVVTREALRREVWGQGTHVDFERGLNFCVLQIRGALGDDAEAPRYVQTLPRRGYRFVAPVERFAPGAAGPGGEPARGRRSWPFALGLGAVIVAAYVAVTPGEGDPVSDRSMLAVLPFDNLSGDPEQDYFSEGVTDELITQLGRLEPARLGVIARSSVLRFRETRPPLDEIGRRLGVGYALEGSVRRDANRVRVTARLVRVDDGSLLWSEAYERDAPGSLALQNEIARRVAGSLAVRLVPDREPARARVATRSPEARDALMKGRALLRRGGRDNFVRGAEFVEQAARLDPDFAAAQAVLAELRHRQRLAARPPALQLAREALQAAERAVALDETLAEARVALAAVRLWHEWDPEAAGVELRRALELNPSSAEAHHDYAWHWIALGRPDAAIRAIRAAQELDPLSPRASCDVGWIYLRARRYAQAAAQCRRALDLEPGYRPAESCLATAYERLGLARQALPLARESMLAAGANAETVASLDAAEPTEALRRFRRWRLERMLDEARGGRPDHYHIAIAQAGLGLVEEAFASLDALYAQRSPSLVVLDAEPDFDPLRADPRFSRLAARVREARPLSDGP